MSKVDAQRAMREARFEALTAQAAGTSTRRAARASKTPASASATASDAARPSPATQPSPAPEPAPAAESADAVETDLCGHRNMGNKSCRRPKGHSEKNHRYT